MGIIFRARRFAPRGGRRLRRLLGLAPSVHWARGFAPRRADLPLTVRRLPSTSSRAVCRSPSTACALQLTELHRLELELQGIPLDFPWTRSGHLTPPAVRWKCLLYRGRSPRQLQAHVSQALRDHASIRDGDGHERPRRSRCACARRGRPLQRDIAATSTDAFRGRTRATHWATCGWPTPPGRVQPRSPPPPWRCEWHTTQLLLRPRLRPLRDTQGRGPRWAAA